MRKAFQMTLSLVAMLMVTLNASAWKFTLNSPAEGEVTQLFQIVLDEPAGTMWVDEMGAMPCTVTCSDGTSHAYNFSDNFSAQVVGNPADFTEIKTPGTYTLTVPAGTFHINGEGNEAFTATWTIKASDTNNDGDNTGNGGNQNQNVPFEFGYDKTSGHLTCTWPDGTFISVKNGGASLSGFDGYFNLGPVFFQENILEAYVSLPDGDYTLNIPAGAYTIDDVDCEAMTYAFTIGGTQGGGNSGDFEGTPFHETIFKAGEGTPTIPFAVDNENVNIVTEGRPFMDTTIDVGYNMNLENELNWKNGTKFIITAKQDINKVIFVPTADSKNAVNYASSEGGNGSYSNGVWEGKLAAGETLTLTASDGINIKELYICYNGDDYDPTEGNVNVKGVITIQYPVENQLIEKQVDGGKFCVFTTNKEYAQVTIEVKNSNPVYDNLYKFPTRMVDNMGEKSDNLHVGENTVTAATPGGGSAGHGDDWYWFKGDSYTMIVRGYVNPWDAAEDYDAIAEVHFVGNGVEHAAESLVKLLNVTPATSLDAPAEIAEVNGIITLEFDNAVQSVEALTPGGQMDPTIYYTASAKDGSDNKVWEINLGDRSGYASADTDGDAIIEINVTAKDADGGVVAFSDDRADRGLTLKYKLVSGSSNPTNVVTLGSPVWSVAEGEEIEASTKSINISFPSATNVEAGYTLEVVGTIADRAMNFSVVSGTGTMGAGANIAVNLSEDAAYNIAIGTITVKNGSTVVYSTEMANYQLNFETKSAQGGGNDGTDVLGEPTFTATADGIVVEWPNANVSSINECVILFGEWTLTHNGVDYTTYPDQLEDFTNGVKVEIPYSKVAAWDDVNYVYVPVEVAPGDEINISIAAEGLQVYANYYSSFDPAIYSNASAITGTVTVPGGEAEAKEVVVYEEGVDVHTDNTEINFAKGGVTFTSTTNGSAYIVNNFKPGCNASTAQHLRVWSYNTLHFSASSDITKIEFVAPTASYKYTLKSVSTGSFADNVWTGSAKDVDIVFGNGNHDIVKVIVTLAGGTATAIQNVESVKNATVMYNLAGQRINNAKGIVIMNGKKFMVK